MNLWGFICAAVVMTLMPGPDILFVITQSITRGRTAGIVFAAGLCTGLIAYVTVVSLGVSVVVLLNSPVAFAVLRYAGVAYLLYLSVRTFLLRHRNKLVISTTGGATGKLYRKGILMNMLNPKVMYFFVALFSTFVDTSAGNPMPQMFLLGLIFIVQAFIIFSIVAILAERLSRRLMSNPRISLMMNIVEAAVYGIVAVCFAVF